MKIVRCWPKKHNGCADGYSFTQTYFYRKERRGTMRITRRWLKKHYACEEGCNWFIRRYPKAGGADAKTVLVRLQAEKLGNWSLWLVQEAKLSATIEDWYTEGQLLSRRTFKKGIRHGNVLWWRTDGTLFLSGSYKNGKEDGVSEFWGSAGNLIRREIYRKGELIKILSGKGTKR